MTIIKEEELEKAIKFFKKKGIEVNEIEMPCIDFGGIEIGYNTLIKLWKKLK